MNDRTHALLVTVPCIVCAYTIYVVTTRGDGIAFASVLAAITGITTYILGNEKGKREAFRDVVLRRADGDE